MKLSEEIVDLGNSLGIPRDEMPQIEGKNIPEFLKNIKKDGTNYETVDIESPSLKPSQNELDTEKAEKIFNDGTAHDHPIIVSKDNYVLDGHHRWLAVLNHEEGGTIKCHQIELDAEQALELMHSFGKSVKRDIDDNIVEMKLSKQVINMSFDI